MTPNTLIWNKKKSLILALFYIINSIKDFIAIMFNYLIIYLLHVANRLDYFSQLLFLLDKLLFTH